jgi:hypothetical protein
MMEDGREIIRGIAALTHGLPLVLEPGQNEVSVSVQLLAKSRQSG